MGSPGSSPRAGGLLNEYGGGGCWTSAPSTPSCCSSPYKALHVVGAVTPTWVPSSYSCDSESCVTLAVAPGGPDWSTSREKSALHETCHVPCLLPFMRSFIHSSTYPPNIHSLTPTLEQGLVWVLGTGRMGCARRGRPPSSTLRDWSPCPPLLGHEGPGPGPGQGAPWPWSLGSRVPQTG